MYRLAEVQSSLFARHLTLRSINTLCQLPVTKTHHTARGATPPEVLKQIDCPFCVAEAVEWGHAADARLAELGEQ